MPIQTALCDLLNIDHPILLAPMAGVSGGALAAAVSEAGGLGLIGLGYGDADWQEAQFDAANGARVGAGFITWSLARQPDLLAQALARNPAAVLLSFGDFQPFVPQIRNAGSKIIVQIQTLKQAQHAIDLGVDAIVAQGTEAGGHGGERATFPLVPAIVDIAGDIPVIAAGGIADGRGLAAALALGAAGVLCGTVFYAADESLASDNAKSVAINGSGDDTERSSVFDLARGIDWPPEWNIRTMRNSFTRQWSGNIAGLTENLMQEQARFEAARAADNTDISAVIVGEAADLVRRRESAQQTLQKIVREADTRLQALARMVDSGAVRP
ncbi:MAG: NAD(P)H-dependent flavin oxidoreductase [Burkholderiaceae bacterium]